MVFLPEIRNVEFISRPYLVGFAGNPMRYAVASTGSSGGAVSLIHINITGIDMVADHEMVVDLMGVERKFTLKDTPSDPFHLPVAGETMDATGWADALFDRLERNYSLVNDYDLSRVDNVITLAAKKEGPEFDLDVVSNNITGFGLTATGGTVGGSIVQGVLMQVRRVNGNLLLGEDYKEVDASGLVRFDVAEYVLSQLLKDYTSSHFHLVKVTGASVFTYADLVLKYRTGFSEKINGVFQPFFYDAYKYVLEGGLSRESLVRQVPTAGGMFYEKYWQESFLTWCPNNRTVSVNQPISLYFLFQSPTEVVAPYKIVLSVTSTSGSTVRSVLKTFTPTPQYSIVEILAGYAQLGVSSMVTGTVKSWSLWVGYGGEGDEGRISEFRTFYPGTSFFEMERTFYFKNSFGVFDSLGCTGKFKTTIEHARQQVKLLPSDPETAFNAPVLASRIDELQTFKACTGWLSREYLDYLRDFLRSTEVYEIDSEGNVFKCILTSGKAELFEDRQYNYNLSFEYERAYADTYFSRFTSYPNP
jgi:hypothetical protein